MIYGDEVIRDCSMLVYDPEVLWCQNYFDSILIIFDSKIINSRFPRLLLSSIQYHSKLMHDSSLKLNPS